MTKNRNNRAPAKRAERQVKTPGAFPFHRVAKMQKLLQRVNPYHKGRPL